jgi:alpha-beta hydrolase superfamily lysophospholipase
MIPCHAISFETPKKVLLNGLWFGSKEPRCIYVWLHGLSSSMWSRHRIIGLLAMGDVAVLAFSNRGQDIVTRVQKGTRRVVAGGGAEIFTDCVDDIDGAIRFARSRSAQEIVLVGHSTGCQKAIYWAYNRKSAGVKGIVLLAPLSDWASANAMRSEQPLIKGATQKARALVKKGMLDAFLPGGVWHHPITAQRFLSLYTPDSIEQSIFPYFDDARSATMFESVTVPILALFAGKDEYGDRPAKKIEEWFRGHQPKGGLTTAIIPGADHGFKGGEQNVAKNIAFWVS